MTQTQSRQYRRQMARLKAKTMRYTRKHSEFLTEQGPAYEPHFAGRIKAAVDKFTGITISLVRVYPKDYPRQSARQAARYARQTG